MDSKVTLSFDQEIIAKAKAYAEQNNISLSRLTEFLLAKVVSGSYASIDQLPVADWVQAVAEGEAQYVRKNSKQNVKKEYFESKGK